MKNLEFLFKSLADRNRLRILALLCRKKMCVCELAPILGITQPSVSRHLKKLKSAGVIVSEQDSFWTNYCLPKQNRSFLKRIVAEINSCLAQDKCFKRDIRRSKKINRYKLC